MNLDELQQAWNNDTKNDIPEVSFSKQKELKQPLDIIISNLKLEFSLSVLSVICLIVCCFLYIKSKLALTYSLTLCFCAVLICIYYFFKFKFFYNKAIKVGLTTYQSLLELSYDLKFFKELYTSYYISFVPIIFCEVLLVFLFKSKDSLVGSSQNVFIFILFFIAALGFLYLFFTISFGFMYGKYINQVDNLLNQIRHPYESFSLVKDNSILRIFHFSNAFFKTKFGFFGQLVNMFLCFVLLSLMMILFIFVCTSFYSHFFIIK